MQVMGDIPCIPGNLAFETDKTFLNEDRIHYLVVADQASVAGSEAGRDPKITRRMFVSVFAIAQHI